MRTTALMSLSAVFMGILGIATSFMPQEILIGLRTQPNGNATLLVQTAGALYLGFAILNWMAKNVMIGGIYARPVALGNLFHFVVASLAGWKAVAAGPIASRILLTACCFFTAFALWFGLVLFTHPRKDLMRRVRLIFRRDCFSFLERDALFVPVREIRHVDSDCRAVSELD